MYTMILDSLENITLRKKSHHEGQSHFGALLFEAPASLLEASSCMQIFKTTISVV